MELLTCIFIILCLVSGSIGEKGFGPGQQEWGLVEVRPGAHMFWWLYYTAAKTKYYTDKPLIIWLQGGPGESSTLVGNFLELGYIDENEKERDYSWVKDYNVLFIDSPVGTGFSYVENEWAYATTNAQIANDLLECIHGFYTKLSAFKRVPTYIATEDYGGKMGAEFALIWYRAQEAGIIDTNLKGIVLGCPWISPIDSVMAWKSFLLWTGLVDTAGSQEIYLAANMVKDYVETSNWENAVTSMANTLNVISEKTYNVNLLDISKKVVKLNHSLSQNVSSFDSETIYRHFIQRKTQLFDDYNYLMNGKVKDALALNVSHHGKLNTIVLHSLKQDFLKPVTNIVQQLLDKTNLCVFVYNGQLDLFVNTPGTLSWVKKLKWKGAKAWRQSDRRPLISKNIVEGYFKTHKNFGMYWVNRAGQMVPSDNPAAMKVILQHLVKNTSKNKKKTTITYKRKYKKTNNK